MPNGIEWNKEELEKYLAPIKTVDPVLNEFAMKYKTTVHPSTYHGYLSREISFVTRSREGNYKLIKSIYLLLSEKRWPPIYRLMLIVSNSYGWKEFLRVIPIFDKTCASWKRIRWEKHLYDFESEINESQLQELLEKAKTILDNLELEKIGSVPPSTA